MTRTKTLAWMKLIGLLAVSILFILIIVGAYLRQADPKTQYGNVKPAFTVPLCAKGVTGILAQEAGCTPNP